MKRSFMRNLLAVQALVVAALLGHATAPPINYVTKNAPPTLILHGSIDELVPVTQSDNLSARLAKLDVPYLCDRTEGWHHAMDLTAEVHDHCAWMMDQFFGMVLPLPSP